MKHPAHGTKACPCCNISPAERLEHLEPFIARVGFGLAPGILDLPSGESTTFTYTVGMAAHGLPEMVVIGVPFEAAVQTLGPAGERLVQGKIKTGVRDDSILQGLDVFFVPAEGAFFGAKLELSVLRSGVVPDLIQMVWPDAKNRFAWDPGFDEKFRERQPILSQLLADVPKPPMPKNPSGDPVERKAQQSNLDDDSADVARAASALEFVSGVRRTSAYRRLN